MAGPHAARLLEAPAAARPRTASVRPSAVQRAWLERGLDQPGGKLPLFDPTGRAYSARTIKSCIERGWAEPWLHNPIKPDWLVCRLTAAGRAALRPRAHGAQAR